MKSDPTVSIIVSAYNRPQVLTFALESVMHSDFDDWELIVVGDGCNEATEKSVRAFTDPRIRFFNLPANTGSQSAPHNEGMRRARGKFVLFLNQDDMYFPDHISKSVLFMEASGAEIAWSPVLVLKQLHSRSGPFNVNQDVASLDGVVAGDRFDRLSFIISSSWVVRRETCLAVGPWLTTEETRLSPSQEWLFRAHRQGRRMAFHKYVSVFCIHSGVRRYSYVIPNSIEHERAWVWIQAGPSERADLLNSIAVLQAAEILKRSRKRLHRRLSSFVGKSLMRSGIHPHAAKRFIKGMGRGRWVENHRRFTSEPPQISPDAEVELGNAAAKNFLGQGWHPGESGGRWTATETAEIFFSLPPDHQRGFLELRGHPLRRPDSVSFALNDRQTVNHVFEGDETAVRLPVDFPGPFRLTITVDTPSSPYALGTSADKRILGFWVSRLRFIEDASGRNLSL